MTKRKKIIFSVLMISVSLLLLAAKLIFKLDISLMDSFAGALLGIGIVFFLFTVLKKNKE
jgi:hypothetical protein